MDWSESAVVEFKKRLTEGVKNGDWTETKKKIQKAIQSREVSRDVKKKEKWWGKTCHERKIQLKEKLRKCKRGNLEVEEYRKERKAYRNWLEKKKSEWNEKILEEVEKDKSEKSFWKIVNEGRKERMQIWEGIEDEKWLKHFKKQLEDTEIERIETNEKNKGRRKLEGEIKEEEILKTIKKLKRKKATGTDGIPNEAWIERTEQLRQELKICLNKVWKEGIFPEEWKTGIIKPIYKRGKKEEVSNYRGITLMEMGYKIYAEILRNRLDEQLEKKEKLDDMQFGFRKGRGTMNAVYTLKKTIGGEIAKEKGRVWDFLADMKAAFDKVKREEIWKKMEELEIEEGLRERIKEIYEDTRCEIEIGKRQ